MFEKEKVKLLAPAKKSAKRYVKLQRCSIYVYSIHYVKLILTIKRKPIFRDHVMLMETKHLIRRSRT